MEKSEIKEIRKKIGNLIEKSRINQNYSEENISNDVGINNKTLHKIEAGKFSPSSDLLFTIFNKLSIEVRIDNEIIKL